MLRPSWRASYWLYATEKPPEWGGKAQLNPLSSIVLTDTMGGPPYPWCLTVEKEA